MMPAGLYEIARQVEEAYERRRDFPRRERERYRAAGWRVVDPGTPAGAALWFNSRDFSPDSFLAVRDSVIEISLITARKPGNRAFTTLRDRLEAAGFAVRICCPIGQFRAALIGQGYVVRLVGSTFADRKEIFCRPGGFCRPGDKMKIQGRDSTMPETSFHVTEEIMQTLALKVGTVLARFSGTGVPPAYAVQVWFPHEPERGVNHVSNAERSESFDALREVLKEHSEGR